MADYFTSQLSEILQSLVANWPTALLACIVFAVAKLCISATNLAVKSKR